MPTNAASAVDTDNLTKLLSQTRAVVKLIGDSGESTPLISDAACLLEDLLDQLVSGIDTAIEHAGNTL